MARQAKTVTPKSPTKQSANLPVTGFIRLHDLIQFVPFGKSTIWRKVKAKKFPVPVKLSDRITAWRAEEIRAWINEQGAKEAA